MPKISYLDTTGELHVVDSPVGQTVADCATRSGVPGIVAECGGAMSCATCHVYVDEEWHAAVGPPVGLEDDMLDDTLSERRPGSRLSCQVTVTDQLDGLRVQVPVEQQ